MLSRFVLVLTLGTAACGAEPATADPSPPKTKVPAKTVDEWTASGALKATLAKEVPADLRDLWSSRVVKVEPVEAPYLAKATIYRGTRTMRVGEPTVHHPSTWLVARAPGKGLRMLNAKADWDALRADDGLQLDTDARRLAYVRAYVAGTGHAEQRYAWIVDSVDELQLLTKGDKAAAAQALDKKYRPIIKPLALTGKTAPWKGVAFANGRHLKIVRIDIRLASDGTIVVTDTVLEKDAPIPSVSP